MEDAFCNSKPIAGVVNERNGDITPADNSHTSLFALYSDTQFFAQDVQLNSACADQARSCWQFQSILMIWQVFHLLY
jgi:hypothetical protein